LADHLIPSFFVLPENEDPVRSAWMPHFPPVFRGSPSVVTSVTAPLGRQRPRFAALEITRMKKTSHLVNGLACTSALFVTSLVFSTICRAQTPSPPEKPPAALDVNDISFLFPVPTTKAEVDALISLNDEAAEGKIFPDELLVKLIDEAKTVSVGSSRISLPNGKEEEFKKPITWKVAGIRVNPSALGINPKITQPFGIIPGIRLIVQPVTVEGNNFKIHDFTAHVVFDYTVPRTDGKRFPILPDDKAFGAIVEDLRKLKTFSEESGAPTAGKELSVHPALAKNVPGFTDRLRALLKTHLRRERLDVVSFMGIPGAFEPWIFFKVTIRPDGTLMREDVSGNFDPKPQSQMLVMLPTAPRNVEPAPVLSPTAAQNGFGVSTAPLFSKDAPSHLDDKLFPSATDPLIAKLRNRDVVDMIANPQFHNTANTDCVSCHTETTRRTIIPGMTSQPGLSFQQPAGISTVAAAMLPKDKWNLRNFGWGFNFGSKTFTPSITHRAANEAAESADFINKPLIPPTPAGQPVASRDSDVHLNIPR
jgi:hypothetical protein